MSGGTDGFPPGFFDRIDPGDDAAFYGPPRLVTHIDDAAIDAVGELYDELGIDGDVLDLMSSWVSHFHSPPRHLRVLGMNASELDANPLAAERIVHDLNADPRLPLLDHSVDDAVCCVSVDYLVRPVEAFRDVARVLRPGGRLVCTFSNRLFPTKAVHGWLRADDEQRMAIVAEYFRRSRGFGGGYLPPVLSHRGPPHTAPPPRRPTVRGLGHPALSDGAQADHQRSVAANSAASRTVDASSPVRAAGRHVARPGAAAATVPSRRRSSRSASPRSRWAGTSRE